MSTPEFGNNPPSRLDIAADQVRICFAGQEADTPASIVRYSGGSKDRPVTLDRLDADNFGVRFSYGGAGNGGLNCAPGSAADFNVIVTPGNRLLQAGQEAGDVTDMTDIYGDFFADVIGNTTAKPLGALSRLALRYGVSRP